jgi:hypothetical protein
MRDKRQTMLHCDRGNLQVVWPDYAPIAFKLMANRCAVPCAHVIKGKRSVRSKKNVQFGMLANRIRTSLGTVS